MTKLFAKFVSGFLIISLIFSTNAFAISKDVVRDRDGKVVISVVSKNCVRTKWDVPTDYCGSDNVAIPAQVTEPAPAPLAAKPLDKISTEERTIYFDYNKSNLRSDSIQKLDNMINSVQDSNKVVSAKVYGYADRIGKEDYNRKLSEKRADAVAKYLEQGGVQSRVMKIEGFGESQPVTTCSTSTAKSEQIKCLQADRRVQVELDVQK